MPGFLARRRDTSAWLLTAVTLAIGWVCGVLGIPWWVLGLVAAADALALGTSAVANARAGKARADQVANLTARVETADQAAAAARETARRAAQGLLVAAELAVRTEEVVRARIVADLHDTVAQTLVVASYARFDPDVTRDQIADLAHDAEVQLRDIMLNQRPLSDARTLAQLLANFFEWLELQYGVRVTVSWPEGDYAFPYAVAVVIYRFAHEALMNVAKHAAVEAAELALTVTAAHYLVEVHDNGVGFDTDTLSTSSRLGVELLTNRASVVGGRVTVESAPGQGTTMRLWIPVAPPAADPEAVNTNGPGPDGEETNRGPG